MKKTFEVKGVDLTSLYGVGDKNILILESQLPLKLNIRGNNIFCQGLKKDINHFDSVLSQMIDSIKKGNTLSTKDITQLVMINESANGSSKNSRKNGTIENVLFYGKKGPVFPRTDGQKALVKSFLKNDIIISVGPAGTGKTFLAVAYALALLEKHEIEKKLANADQCAVFQFPENPGYEFSLDKDKNVVMPSEYTKPTNINESDKFKFRYADESGFKKLKFAKMKPDIFKSLCPGKWIIVTQPTNNITTNNINQHSGSNIKNKDNLSFKN